MTTSIGSFGCPCIGGMPSTGSPVQAGGPLLGPQAVVGTQPPGPSATGSALPGMSPAGLPPAGMPGMGGGAVGAGMMGGGAMMGGGMMGAAPAAGMSGMSMVMSATPRSEFEYLAHMIPHHEEAIASARQLYAGTARPEMRDFALRIIDTQSREVTAMRSYLATWYPGVSPAAQYHPMMRDLTGLTPSQVDQTFLQDMIPHHMMAVHNSMATNMRGLAQHPETAQLASSIQRGQMVEIGEMRGWLASWYGG